jgi:tetratricopeptide (TPR) repeat protein
MRLAIVSAASAQDTPDPTVGERDGLLFCERFALPDLGFTVCRLDPELDLAEQLDVLLGERYPQPDDLIFYASCLVAMLDDGECFLCLDPSHPDVGDSLRELTRVIGGQAARTLMVVEGRYENDAADQRLLKRAVEAMASCVSPVDSGVELVAAVRPRGAHKERIPSRMTAALLEVIDETAPHPLSARQAYTVAARRDLGSWPHALLYVPVPDPMWLRERPSREIVLPVEPARAAAPAAAPPPAPSAPPPRASPAAPSPPAPAAELVDADIEEAPPPPPAPPSAPRSSKGRPPLRPAAPASEKREAAVARMPARRPTPPPEDALPKVVVGAPSRGRSAPPPPVERLRPPEPEAAPGRQEEPPPSSEAIELELDELRETGPRPAAPPPPRARRAGTGPVAKPATEWTVEDHIAAGDAEVAAGFVDKGLGEYKKALGKLGTVTTPLRADIYVRIGDLMRKRGKAQVAISNYDKALSIRPTSARALGALVELYAEQGNWRAVQSAEDRCLAELDDADQRLAFLLASGDRYRDQAGDGELAKKRYLQAREAQGRRREPHERLLSIYQKEKAVEHVLDCRRRLAALATTPKDQARAHFEIGEYCMFEVKRPEEALASFELALDNDPMMLEALEVLATQLAEDQEWGELERIYHKMISRYEKEASPERSTARLELLHRLALLYRDHLEDPESALRAVEKAIADAPERVSARVLAAELVVELNQPRRALDHLRELARLEPRRVETYDALCRVARRAGEEHTAVAAARVARALGAAGDDALALLEREQGEEAVPPYEKPLSEVGWDLLRGPGGDPVVDAVMAAIAPGVLRMRVSQLDAEGKLPPLSPEDRQDAATSTASVVRSLAWGSQMLGVPLPAVYVNKDAPGALLAPFAKHQTTVVGRDAMQGRSPRELAFLVGRHLALRRPEHELVAHVLSVDELTVCFLAAVKVVLGAAPAPAEHAVAVDALATALAPHFTPGETEALRDAVQRFSRGSGRVHLRQWAAAVEICATRAGLLLSGVLDGAMAVLGREGEGRALVPLERRLDDLFAFSVSEAFLRLRGLLGEGPAVAAAS